MNTELTRENLPEKYHWRLEDIYPDQKSWEEDARLLTEKNNDIKKYQGFLGQSASSLFSVLKAQDEINIIAEKLVVFAMMKKDEDNSSSKAQALANKAISLAVASESSLSFVIPEILEIPQKTLEKFLQENTGLDLYAHYLNNLMRQKEHFLKPAEEKIISLTGEMAQGPRNIYSMMHNADLTFPTINIEGSAQKITHGNFIDLLQRPERETRKKVYEAVYDTYQKQLNTWSAVLNASVTKDLFYTNIRKFPFTLTAALFEDNLKEKIYENLIDSVHENIDSLHDYVELRKNVLGVSMLEMFDIYLPLIPRQDFKYSYEDAQKLVLESLRPMGQEYLSIISQAFKSRWIDVYELPGKTSGAYSNSCYGIHPYILLNFNGNLDSGFTLAHELGHALHSYYTNQNQPFIYSGYSIFIAEIASTFNESLLLDYLLKITNNEQQKLFLLQHFLEQVRGTVFRQTMFAEFEKKIHQEVAAGGTLTPKYLCETYLQLNQYYYGPAMHSDHRISREWARIPHFYNSFYVFKYATGFSAAQTFSSLLQEKGAAANEGYLNLLKKGSANYPLELLKEAGVDMTKPTAIETTLKLFKSRLKEFRQIMGR